MTVTDGNLLSADDPRIVGVGGTPSGFTHLSEKAPDRPSNRQIFLMGLTAVLLALLLGGTAAVSTLAFSPRYQARAEVQYRGSAWTETQNIRIQSRSLNGPIAEAEGIDIKVFEQNLESGLIPGTQILQVDYVSTDREQARRIVSLIADEYIALITEDTTADAQTLLSNQLEQVEVELAAARAELRELATDSPAALVLDGEEAPSTELSESGSTDNTADIGDPEAADSRVRIQVLQQETNSLAQRKNDLESRLLDAELRALDIEAKGKPEIVTDPFVFEDPVFPRPKVFGFVGFLAGLALGGVFMAWKWNRTAWASIDSVGETAPVGASPLTSPSADATSSTGNG